MKDKAKRTVYIYAIVFTMLYTAPFYLHQQFGALDLNQVLYLFISNQKGANMDWIIILNYILFTLPFVLLVLALVSLFYYMRTKFPVLNQKIMDHKPRAKAISSAIVLLLVGLLLFDFKFQVFSFIKTRSDTSILYERYYVNPDTVEISFPQTKQNLIYIVLESLNTNFDHLIIDDASVNLIPNLKTLAQENLNLSHTSGFGGAQQLNGLSWTMASLVGMSSGIHLSVLMGEDIYKQDQEFLPGVKAIGEILAEAGYANYFLLGSDGKYAGRQTYFETHGDYEVIDINTLKAEAVVPQDYNVFWGVEDTKLFSYAKTKLLEVAEFEQPFNFTLLTVDTHFMEGYMDPTCYYDYGISYANAIACADDLLGEFMDWIAAQDFYENTTVILIGDHNTMNDGFLSLRHDEQVSIYNAMLNVNLDYDPKFVNHRDFSVLDMFPTTLAALGATIEGERLGLGVNVFSGEPTLLERLGKSELNNELIKQSDYYEHFYKP